MARATSSEKMRPRAVRTSGLVAATPRSSNGIEVTRALQGIERVEEPAVRTRTRRYAAASEAASLVDQRPPLAAESPCAASTLRGAARRWS